MKTNNMARIVKSQDGFWVGKELYKAERYISFDNTIFSHPRKQVVKVSWQELTDDILQILHVQVLTTASDATLQKIALELCRADIGCFYCSDWQAPYGVRKILNAPKI